MIAIKASLNINGSRTCHLMNYTCSSEKWSQTLAYRTDDHLLGIETRFSDMYFPRKCLR
jgi:hypothetical protein